LYKIAGGKAAGGTRRGQDFREKGAFRFVKKKEKVSAVRTLEKA